jgi:flagella basal body P-ring formation protein FlgA
MSDLTTRIMPVGKHFLPPVSDGKKCRALRRIARICTAAMMLAGGLGMLEAQDPEAAEATLGSEFRARVTFKADSVVSGPEILLRDVATIESDDAELVQRLSRLVVGPRPRVGQTISFRGRGVRLLVRGSRRELGLSDSEIDVAGARTTKITVESQTIGPADLLDRVRPWLVNEAQQAYGADRVELDYRTPPRPITIGVGAWELRPMLAQLPRIAPSVLSVPVTLLIDGQVVGSSSLALNLQAYATIAVAKRGVARREAVTDADVEYLEKDITELKGLPIVVDADDLIGLRATRSLRMGEPLTDLNCELLPLIEKGDFVIVYIEAPYLRLTVKGEAQEDGRAGDVVRVRNIDSDEIIHATVIRKRLVRVELATSAIGAEDLTALAP